MALLRANDQKTGMNQAWFNVERDTDCILASRPASKIEKPFAK